MENPIYFQSMKNEMAQIIRDENRKMIEKLDSQNSTMMSLSEELKSVRKGKHLKCMVIFFIFVVYKRQFNYAMLLKDTKF